MTAGQIPFTPRAKKVLDLALREALSLGHKYIGTEHILLGIVRENNGVAIDILRGLDTDAPKVRDEVLRQLGGMPRPAPPRRLRRRRRIPDWLFLVAGVVIFAGGLGLGWLIWG